MREAGSFPAPLGRESGGGPTLVSLVPGRARLVWSALRGASSRCLAARRAALELPGVREVRVYPRTGSLVVAFDDGRFSADALLAAVRRLQPQGEGPGSPDAPPERGHPSAPHDALGVALAGTMLARHVLLGGLHGLPDRHLAHVGGLLALLALFPVLRGIISPSGALGVHALELLATLAALRFRENRGVLALVGLLHVAEAVLLLRRRPRALTSR
ncbi:MAG TPA: hypothetical protein VIN09_02975 [Chloroflexota bacterium]